MTKQRQRYYPKALFSVVLWVCMTQVGGAIATPEPLFSGQYEQKYEQLSSGLRIIPTEHWRAYQVSLPFPFELFGDSFSTAHIGHKGLISFAHRCDQGCPRFGETCDVPTFTCFRNSLFSGSLGLPSAPQSLLAAYWDDLSFNATGNYPTEIRFETRGTPPHREFIVDWQNMVHHQALPSSTRSRTSFQARLYEPNSIVELHFGESFGTSDTPSWSGQIGIEGANGDKVFRPIHCNGRQQGCDWQRLEQLQNKIIIFGAFDGPELIAQFRGPTGGRSSESVTAELFVSNVGTQSTNLPFNTNIYLEETTSATVTTTRLATHTFEPLGSSQSVTSSLTFTLPVLTSSASYRLVAHIDEENVVSEGAVQNNKVYAPGVFSTNEDFSIGALQAGLDQRNSDLRLETAIINAGPRINDIEIRLYSSQDTVLDSGDTLLMSEHIAIPALERTQYERSIPNASGVVNTYLFIILDPEGHTQDAFRADNSSMNGPILAQPDLSLTVESSHDVTIGETNDFEIMIENNGAYATAVDWRIFYSVDRTLDNSDYLIASGRRDIGLNRESHFYYSASIPTIPGGFYNVISVVDPANEVSESDETNNTQMDPHQTEVIGIDLSAFLSSAQSTLYLNQVALIDFTASNSQASIAPETRVDFYLSDNRLISATDTLIGTATVASLGPNGEVLGQFSWSPTSTNMLGQKFLGIVIDPQNKITETNEQNNKFALPQPITILPEAPDFQATYLDAYDVTGTGDTIDVAFEIQNNGVIESPASVALYLSSSPTFDSSSAELVFEDITNLAPRTRDIRSARIAIPTTVAAGEYFFTLVCDPNRIVDELDESNNTLTMSESVTIERSAIRIANPELPRGVLDYEYQTQLFLAGTSDNVVWSLEGLLPAGVSFDPATAKFQGIPRDYGAFEIVIFASARTWTVSKSFILRISETNQTLAVATPGLPVGQVGSNYDYALTARGGSGTITWSTQERFPQGVSLTPTGRIIGKPETTSNQSIVVIATDEIGDSVSKTLKLKIVDNDNKLQLTFVPSPRLYLAQDVNMRIESRNAVLPTSLSVYDGMLPPGLTLEGEYLRGSPQALGEFPFILEITDSVGQTNRETIIIEVIPRDGFEIGPDQLPLFRLNEISKSQLEFQLRNETNSAEMPVFEVIQGRLPAGVKLDPQGRFQGAPAELGRFDFVVEGITVSGDLGQQALTLLVLDAKPLVSETETCSCRNAHVPLSDKWLWLIGLISVGILRRKQKSPAS